MGECKNILNPTTWQGWIEHDHKKEDDPKNEDESKNYPSKDFYIQTDNGRLRWSMPQSDMKIVLLGSGSNLSGSSPNLKLLEAN